MDLPCWECLIEALHAYLLGQDPNDYESSDVLINRLWELDIISMLIMRALCSHN